jgi:transcriptional regulator
MYVPEHYEESRPERLHALIAQHPLGVLVTSGSGGLDANHLPFELETREGSLGVLHSHVARANPVWRELASGDEVLVVFRGAHAYISPNWYPSKHEHHRQVPTWNYMVAHAHGRVTVHDDERYVRGVVARLTKRHEATLSNPWRMSDSSEAFIKEMLASIVGLEVEITRLIGKFKISQNKERRDVVGAANALKDHGDRAVADAMLAHFAERTGDSTS